MKLKSMTGFGRAEVSNDQYRLSVEVKSVNSRFLDLSIKTPKKFNALEANIRNTVKEYLESMRTLVNALGVEDNVKVTNLASLPDVLVLSEESEDDDALWESLKPSLTGALERFSETRVMEGENLQKDLIGKLSEMEAIVNRIDERSPEITAAYEARLRAKVSELLEGTGIDEARIVQEVTIYSDKICTDEERVRLHSHIKNMRTKLQNGGLVGRELDFVAQEMNREANTTLSKANDLIVSEDAIGLKTLIEKIREQIQNLE